MKVVVFSAKPYDIMFLTEANRAHGHELTFLEARLTEETAPLAGGSDAVCVFPNDRVDGSVLEQLKALGVKLVALRSAGFNHVDLQRAAELGLVVARVPAYSPQAVAEHTVTLILALNRQIHRAYNRVREGNFSLDGLMGFVLDGKTVGVIGTGKIGLLVAQLLHGFGCHILAHDPYPAAAAPDYLHYTPLHELYRQADIITLHCPLTPDTRHLIDSAAVAAMKDGVMLINTSRGGLVNTPAVTAGLKSRKIGRLGLDVYEEEEALFFDDLSNEVLQDDVFARLLTFPNVLITGHQAFFTREAVTRISETTLSNISNYASGQGTVHTVTAEQVSS
jgi:D-lactate dehydrogenase